MGIHELQYEHIIPKTKNIRNICENTAKKNDGSLTEDFIYDVLQRYLWTATIHLSENEDLKDYKNKMPDGWDGANIFYRYEVAGVMVDPHDKSYMNTNKKKRRAI